MKYNDRYKTKLIMESLVSRRSHQQVNVSYGLAEGLDYHRSASIDTQKRSKNPQKWSKNTPLRACLGVFWVKKGSKMAYLYINASNPKTNYFIALFGTRTKAKNGSPD